ncbi:hypothetical protein R3P38DRAFT_2579259 [Favolaschia claudopus]|uniref:Uncharacterized protein n=1 Tax=Favolaschia claudopus TaxID=2862362 RepID=A0AAV9ZFI4_9AGAR
MKPCALDTYRDDNLSYLRGRFTTGFEEDSYEFTNMQATSKAETEFVMGREPADMSRPATTFMDAQGTGVHMVMSAKTALDLGCPIRGILAFTSTYLIVFHSDKACPSIPAPGLGPLSIARQISYKNPIPIIDLVYRRTQISQWLNHEHSQLQEEIQLRKSQGEPINDESFTSRVAKEDAQQDKDALAMCGMLQGADPRVAPIHRVLAVWGIDVGVLSIHGTSIKANVNETRIWNDIFIFSTIGRTQSNAVPIVAQKSLLGHFKGGLAAWQMGGLLQTVSSE